MDASLLYLISIQLRGEPNVTSTILLPAKDEACSAFLVLSPHPFGRDADEALTLCYLPFRIAR
ncbi:hypothetical protein THL1_3764 [Pseudomonas sp. TCU-HL1]|nr:hypothetical protein THL1_3764 [Pseudomonas sp. TCU-HL1]